MSTTSELERLAELHQRGQLTDEEYTRAKAQTLNGEAPHQPPPAASGTAAAINALRRSRSDRWLGGVCTGLGRFTGLEPWLWRLAFVLMATFAGTGVLAYLLLWIFVPED